MVTEHEHPEQQNDEHHEGHGNEQGEGRGHEQRNRLHVTVHFVASARPFKDNDADRQETVGDLKARVLADFNLVDGAQTPDGVATYTLYFGKTQLENMDETLGTLAGEHKQIELKLNQQLTQGSVR